MDDDDFDDEPDDLTPNATVTMTDYEMKSQEEQFHGIGYLEAFEEAKETRLQEGFETGYTEAFQVSCRIGRILGRCQSMDEKNKGKIFQKVRVFLQEMDKSKTKPSVTKGQMEELEREIEQLHNSFIKI